MALIEKTRNHIYSFVNIFLLFLALLIIQISIVAQRETPIFEQLSVEQGLSFNLVTDIVQDKKGFMWFATADGLNRYDGYNFKIFKPNPIDSNSLTAAYVNRLYADSYGTIWANIVGYLHRFNEVDGKITRLLKGMWLTSMCEDTSVSSNSGMWFATYGNGLHRWNRKQDNFDHYKYEKGNSNCISSDSLLCVFVDKSGTLWIGTSDGLNSMEIATRNVTQYPNGPNCKIYDITEDRKSNGEFIWIGTENGLFRYDKKLNQFKLFKNQLSASNLSINNDVRTLYFDTGGRLWVGMIGGIAGFDRGREKYFTFYNKIQTNPWAYITRSWFIQEDIKGEIWALAHSGTSQQTLLRFNNELKKFLPYPSSEYPLTLYSMFIDKLGTMWLGSVDRGVLKIDAKRKPFFNYLSADEQSTGKRIPVISGITEDKEGLIWLGSNNGLYNFNPYTGIFKIFKHEQNNHQSLSSDDIGPVFTDYLGNVWIGNNEVDVYDKKNKLFHHYKLNDQVNSFVETHDRILYLGMDNGTLAEFIRSSNSFKHHYPDYKGAFDHILMYGLTEDLERKIWFIVRGAGLLSYDRNNDIFNRYYNSPKPYTHPITLSTLGLSSLYSDSRGNLWIGTDAGVIEYEKISGEFSAITEHSGLANQNVHAILEDDNGDLWFGTAGGISKYDPVLKKFLNYDLNDGLKLGPVIKTTGCKTKNGELYFGGSSGFVRFHPDSILQNLYIPPIVITAFKKFGLDAALDTSITEKKILNLSYKDNVISFEFAALNYSSTLKNQYAYKLEGFDNDWIYCGTKRSATYTNLDGGTYIFRVKGSNNDGVWNENGASIIIVITPPFWETWWFRISAFVLLLVSVGGTIRFIEMRKIKRGIELLEKEQAFERERARISRDMHDEVGSSLSEIVILSELAMKKPKEANLRVQEISERAAEVIDNVSDIVWAMNPKNDKLDNLIAHTRHYAIKYLSLANIECQFNAPENILAKNISAQLRRNIFLVFKETLHNVVKHSNASAVTIDIEFSNEKLFTVIKDNGKGFLIENISSAGNGLVNMKKRIEDIGGTTEFKSHPGEGTQISFSVILNDYFN